SSKEKQDETNPPQRVSYIAKQIVHGSAPFLLWRREIEAPGRSCGLLKAYGHPIADCILASRQVSRRRDQAIGPLNPIQVRPSPILNQSRGNTPFAAFCFCWVKPCLRKLPATTLLGSVSEGSGGLLSEASRRGLRSRLLGPLAPL